MLNMLTNSPVAVLTQLGGGGKGGRLEEERSGRDSGALEGGASDSSVEVLLPCPPEPG